MHCCEKLDRCSVWISAAVHEQWIVVTVNSQDFLYLQTVLTFDTVKV